MQSKFQFRMGNEYAEALVKVIEANGYKNVIAAATTFGKDVIPRLGGKLDVQPITDVIDIKVSNRLSEFLE
jgi:electron transfer flavoprotein alpha subunit